MGDSPIRTFLERMDAIDHDGVLSLFAPDAELTMIFGERASGQAEVAAHLRRLLDELRTTAHEITSEWHPEPDVWIAELVATYELTDRRMLGPYRRVIVLRGAEDRIDQLHVYGQHEPQLAASGRPYAEVRGAHGWLPTL